MSDYLDCIQTQVIPFKVGNSTDLRVTGSNLDTGYKGKVIINGKTKSFKVYMTNTGKSLSFYIKRHGKNKALLNDSVYRNSLHELENPAGWYIETLF